MTSESARDLAASGITVWLSSLQYEIPSVPPVEAVLLVVWTVSWHLIVSNGLQNLNSKKSFTRKKRLSSIVLDVTGKIEKKVIENE